MKFTTKNLFIGLLAISLLFTACNTFKGLFSKGQDKLKQASQSWESGDKLKAIYHATNALIIDPEFYQGKVFMKERFDNMLESTQTRLAQIDTPTNSTDAQEKYTTYTTLVMIYDNLKQIKLPLKHPKGKWSWTTDILDFSQQKEQARVESLDLLMKEGRGFVANNDFKAAETSFKTALNYTIDVNQKTAYNTTISSELSKKGSELMNTRNIEQAILANSFYQTAKHFLSTSQEVNDGIASSAAHVSDLYLKQGESLENTGNIEKMIQSVESYKNAIQWSQNKMANDAQTRVTEKIAEYYYKVAINAEKAKDNATAVANYENVRRWIPAYKDAMSRMYNLRIGAKIEELAKNINTTNTTFSRFQSRVTTVSGYVDKSDDVMNKITYVSDKARDVNTYMKSTSSTLKTFSIIPVVGTTTNILGKSIDVAQDPIGGLVGKLDAIEKPVIKPTKEVIGKTKSIVDEVKGKMATTSNVLKTTSDYSLRLKNCISTVSAETNFKEAEIAIEEINKALIKSNTAMETMDKSMTKVESESKKVANMASNVSKVASGFQSVSSAVDKVKPVVDELNATLDKKFGFSSYEYSAREILNGVGGVMKWVMDKLSDLVMAALKPILNKFNINIPSVPGISELKDQLDGLKSTYDVVGAEVNGLKEKVTEYTSAQQLIQTNLTKLEKAVGCKIAPATAQ